MKVRTRLMAVVLLAAAVAACSGAAAPTTPSDKFTVSGAVRERWGVGTPGIQSSVTVVSGAHAGRRITTNIDGTFALTRVPKESIQIRAEAAGFEPLTVDVSPDRPSVELMVEPIMVEDERSLEIEAPPRSNEFFVLSYQNVDIPFTTGRRGPVTVRLSSNQPSCEVSYGGVYGASIQKADGTRLQVAVCPGSPNVAVLTAEKTEPMAPGKYVLQVHMMNVYWVPGQLRKVLLRYPR